MKVFDVKITGKFEKNMTVLAENIYANCKMKLNI